MNEHSSPTHHRTNAFVAIQLAKLAVITSSIRNTEEEAREAFCIAAGAPATVVQWRRFYDLGYRIVPITIEINTLQVRIEHAE